MKKFFSENKWMQNGLAGCIVVIFYLIITRVSLLFDIIHNFIGFLTPVLLGLIVAYILDPLVKHIEMKALWRIKCKKIRRVTAVWLAVAMIGIFIGILSISLIPQLIKSVKSVISNIHDYAARLEMAVNTFGRRFSVDPGVSGIAETIYNTLDNLVTYDEEGIARLASTVLSVSSSMITGIIAVVIAIYLLCDKERLVKGAGHLLLAILPDKYHDGIVSFGCRCHNILVRYIAGDILDSLIVGILNFVFMSCTGMEYSVLISVIVGVTNLAPTFGPMVGVILGVLLLALGKPMNILLFLIFAATLQSFDAYYIKPKLFGNTLGISPVWILICIVVLGRMFGVIGLLVAIPFAAISDVIVKEIIIVKLRKKGKDIALE